MREWTQLELARSRAAGAPEGCADLVSEGLRTTPEGFFVIDRNTDTPTMMAELDPERSLRALQQNLEELRTANSALRKENSSLREQLSVNRTGVEGVLGQSERRGGPARSSCEAEFARSLKLFYHSMTSVRASLQRLTRNRPAEDSDVVGLRLFVVEQAAQLREFSEQLEQSVSSLKHQVAAIVRRKRERSGIWS